MAWNFTTWPTLGDHINHSGSDALLYINNMLVFLLLRFCSQKMEGQVRSEFIKFKMAAWIVSLC